MDHYIVFVAGKYGSADPDGLSYTREEYEYAVSIGKPVAAFLHKNPDSLRRGLTETDAKTQKKLQSFRQLLAEQHLCKMWETADRLHARRVSQSESFRVC
jgi:hypothetical protein